MPEDPDLQLPGVHPQLDGRRAQRNADQGVRMMRRVAALALLFFASTQPALGQTPANGAIRGDARDPTRARLPGTTSTPASPTAPTAFTAVSDRESYYPLLELPPGDYELTAELSSFARFVRPGIAVRAGL